MYIKDILPVYINRDLIEVYFEKCFSLTLILDCAEIDQMGTNLKNTDARFVSTLDFVYI